MTLRLRLTLLYGGCFLVAGVVLLAITYGLVANTTQSGAATFSVGGVPGTGVEFPGPPFLPGQPNVVVRSPGPVEANATGIGIQIESYVRDVHRQAVARLRKLAATQNQALQKVAKRARFALDTQRSSQLSAFITRSGLALVIMAFISIGLGWLLAGRALRPLVTISSRARAITEHSLHERLSGELRDDELGELARTFDGLLARLERAFSAQRRFVANASHELRTPVTLERALVEVALADPDASVESLRECCERVLAAGEQQERLIEALLTLARSQAGIEDTATVDLADVTAELLQERHGDPVSVDAELEPAFAVGDRALIERLVANLIDNAVAYNRPEGGWVRVETASDNGNAVLRVTNTGCEVPVDGVDELFEPFRRLDGERINGGRGLGLGLSIVSAIATAHHASLRARARDGGGLEVEVGFASAGDHDDPADDRS